MGTEGKEPSCDLVLDSLGGIRIGQEIACDLLPDEVVVGLVRVERCNDVIPVFPRDRVRQVAGPSHRVGVANDIEPVTSPALAEALGLEQSIDNPHMRLRRVVLPETLNLLGCRGQTGQVECHASQPVVLRRVGDRTQALAFDRREHVLVNRASGPRLIDHRRKCRFLRSLKRPVLSALLQIDSAGSLLNLHRARVGSPHLDPLDEVRDHLVGEFARRRHLQRPVVADRADDQTGFHIRRHHGMSPLAAFPNAVSRVEAEATHASLGFRGVAGVTIGRENGTDLRFEEVQLLPSRGVCRPGRCA